MALAAITTTQNFGPGTANLAYGDSLVWGPLQIPARVTRTNLRLVNATGWDVAFPSFDVFLLNDTMYKAYIANESFVPSYSGVGSVEGVTRNGAANVTELVISTYWTGESTVYVVFEHGPRQSRRRTGIDGIPESAVSIAWDDFQWVTGREVNELPLLQPCGRRTIQFGEGQHLFYGPLVPTSANTVAIRTEIVSVKPNGVPLIFIFGQANLDSYTRDRSTSQKIFNTELQSCYKNSQCDLPYNATYGPFYMLLAVSGGSGSVTFDFKVNEGALMNKCLNVTAAPGSIGATTASNNAASDASNPLASTGQSSAVASESSSGGATTTTTPTDAASATINFANVALMVTLSFALHH